MAILSARALFSAAVFIWHPSLAFMAVMVVGALAGQNVVAKTPVPGNAGIEIGKQPPLERS